MRYPDGGGLSPAARERRETLRMQAARLFAEDVAPAQVAARLRVSTKSVYQWRRRWRAGGEAGVASPGAGGGGGGRGARGGAGGGGGRRPATRAPGGGRAGGGGGGGAGGAGGGLSAL